MKLIAIHDTDGRISTLLTLPPNSPMGGVEIRADQLKTELEAREIEFDLNDPQIHDRLAEVIKNYRVECKTAKARLVKTADSATSSK